MFIYAWRRAMEPDMSAGMHSLVDDWKRSRDALQAQLSRMNDDPEFPITTLSDEERAEVARELLALMARYDHLIERYGDATGSGGAAPVHG
jgi:hypothetical protein